MSEPTATLLISCPDRSGLVAKIANFIYANGGNIIHAARHTDFATSLFLIRIEWQLESFNLPHEAIATAFKAIAKLLNATWQLHFFDTLPKIALWVTKQDHCLLDLLWRNQAKGLPGTILLIINNHFFLPAFPGAKPYHRAHARGIKIIGATAHYVTKDLGEGSIIEQEVARVNHQDTIAELIHKGKDLEQLVLSRTVRLHLQNKVLVYDNKTVVFS